MTDAAATKGPSWWLTPGSDALWHLNGAMVSLRSSETHDHGVCMDSVKEFWSSMQEELARTVEDRRRVEGYNHKKENLP